MRAPPYGVVFVGATTLALLTGCAGAKPEGADRRALLTPPAVEPAAPASYVIRFETTRGPFDVEVRRDLAPRGADRLHYLVRAGYYDGARFYRVVQGFMAQFGLAADPEVTAVWRERPIPDDSVRTSNARGTVSFATRGPDTRTTQLFVNTGDNARLDGMGFAPLGRVVAGMAVVDSLYAGYGEGPPMGLGPDQDAITRRGERYLARDYPLLDAIRSARIVREGNASATPDQQPPSR